MPESKYKVRARVLLPKLDRLTSGAICLTPDDVSGRAKVRQLTPTEKDYVSAFGEQSHYSRGTDKSGRKRYGIKVSGKKALAEALDMQSAGSRADREWHQSFMARQEQVTLTDRNGTEVKALASSAEGIARMRGMVEKHRYGRNCRRRVGAIINGRWVKYG